MFLPIKIKGYEADSCANQIRGVGLQEIIWLIRHPLRLVQGPLICIFIPIVPMSLILVGYASYQKALTSQQ